MVSNTSWSVYNFRLGLIRRLKELGYEVLVIAPKDSFSTKLISEGFSYINLYVDNYGTNPFQDFKTLRQLHKIYRKNKIDLIFHYTIKPNIYGSLAAAWCKIPSIAVTTGLGRLFVYKNPLVKFMATNFYRLAANLSKEVWFLNESDQTVFIEKKIVAPEKAFLLNSEGVNIQWFKPKRSQPRNTNKVKFLFAGRIIWDKGLAAFAEAAKAIKQSHPEATFQLLGFVDESNPNAVSIDQIERWQKEKIINYLGETSDVRPFLEEAGCLVFPSFYKEGISRILLEASSMAIPIITTNHVGCKEIVEDGFNGLLCEPQNSADLISKIGQFLGMSSAARHQLGLNGRKKVINEFDEELVIKQYLEVIGKLLRVKQPSKKDQSSVK
ncbi:MAG: glycosyltransferase family 4 protein [Saprospiraceae bacterium]